LRGVKITKKGHVLIAYDLLHIKRKFVLPVYYANVVRNIILCYNAEQSSIIASSNSENPSLSVATQCVSSHSSVNILLSTAIIIVYNYKNELYYCHVLLNSGSQMNFITQEFASQLQLAERSLETSVSGVLEKIINANQVVNICVKFCFNNFQEKHRLRSFINNYSTVATAILVHSECDNTNHHGQN